MSQATRRRQWIRRRDLIALVGSAAVAAPLAAHAQQKAMPVIGLLGENPGFMAGILQVLGEAGYVEGKMWRSSYRLPWWRRPEARYACRCACLRRVMLRPFPPPCRFEARLSVKWKIADLHSRRSREQSAR